LRVGRFGILVEERLRGEDYATQTETTLRRLLVDEGLLNGVRLLGRTETFQRNNLSVVHRTHWGNTGAKRTPIHDDRTRSALTEPATEFWSAQMELVAEDIEQGCCRIGINRVDAAVDR
jgi:hypothetical protein